MATSWMKYAFERFFYFLFQTLLPIRVDWFVNSMKLKSWIDATYLPSSLTRQVLRMDRCQDEMKYERCGLCVCQFWLQLPSSILWWIQKYVYQCTNSDDSTKFRFADGGETWLCPTISQGRTCKHTQVRESLSRLVVSLNLQSHFALIHQSTYVSGEDNFAFIIITLASFENDYTGWLAHFRSTRGICLKRLVKWGLFY